MGDPKKQRKKYSPPSHPWQANRIAEEKGLVQEYGLKNKKEIWKLNTQLKNFKAQAKQLITRTDEQAAKEEKLFMNKLTKLNLITPGAKIEDVLDLSIKDVMERRLQTQTIRKGLAKTAKQARQFIVHGHITVNGKKVDVPSYLLTAEEEHTIAFNPKSAISSEEHPERASQNKEIKTKKQEKTEDEEFLEQIKEVPQEKKAKGGAKE